MSRKLVNIINSDREVINLRMESEELINNMEHLSEEEFRQQANKIKTDIDKRIEELYLKLSSNSDNQ